MRRAFMPVFSKALKPPTRRFIAVALIALLILRTCLLIHPRDAAVSFSGMLTGQGKGQREIALYEERLSGRFEAGVRQRPEGRVC
jgi:hypothetical protein